MIEIIHALNMLTWPGAFAFFGLCGFVAFCVVIFFIMAFR